MVVEMWERCSWRREAILQLGARKSRIGRERNDLESTLLGDIEVTLKTLLKGRGHVGCNTARFLGLVEGHTGRSDFFYVTRILGTPLRMYSLSAHLFVFRRVLWQSFTDLRGEVAYELSARQLNSADLYHAAAWIYASIAGSIIVEQ